MPENLDDDARRTVLIVTTISSSFLVGLTLWARSFFIPKLRQRLPTNDDTKNPSLLLGCLWTISLMALLTVLLAVPLLHAGPLAKDSSQSSLEVSSSINFCEPDFEHSRYVAEPANSVSNLASYVPLALLGLFGPPAKTWKSQASGTRFAVCHAALLAIGIGSFALHALFTAWA